MELPTEHWAAAERLASDLRTIFGARLQSLVAYRRTQAEPRPNGGPSLVHTLALVDAVQFTDLSACLAFSSTWAKHGLTMPLILSKDEFTRSLDAFPIEYGNIIGSHTLIAGTPPFGAITVNPEDLRRACEVQIKSHVIHLRGGYLETGGHPASMAQLVTDSADPFRAVLLEIARLSGRQPSTDDELARDIEAIARVSGSVVRDVLTTDASVDPVGLLSAYISVTEKLWEFIDTWRTPAHPARA